MSDVLIDRPELEQPRECTSSAGPTPTPPAPPPARNLTEEVVTDISALKNEPEWMLKNRLKALSTLRQEADAHVGRRPLRHRLRQHQVLRALHREAGADLGRPPDDIKNTYEKLGIPEAERQRLVAGVAAQYESEVVYHQINEDLEAQGVIFMDTDTALREHPEFFDGVLRHRHPGRRQQVRRAEHRRLVGRLVRLRAAGRARRDPAAGLLPHQHREHGPVRAHADHRRRGQLRALHRGLHGPDLQVATRCTPRSSRSS